MYAALAIFGAVVSTLVLPLPEELALMGAGWWAHQGALPLWAAWVAATAGNVVGDTVSYLIGRYFLDRLLRTRLGKRIVSPDCARGERSSSTATASGASCWAASSSRCAGRSTSPSARPRCRSGASS